MRRRGRTRQIVEGSTQTTNSWGLRGPEPDLTATWRGIVLGDSCMQGLFVGDLETPTECLKRDLKARLQASVEILNTGHLGYSPEQYYYTLLEYARRFPPQFVVISLCRRRLRRRRPGGPARVRETGKRACYWLGEIRHYCSQQEYHVSFRACSVARSTGRRSVNGLLSRPGQQLLTSDFPGLLRPDRRFCQCAAYPVDRGEGSTARQQLALRPTVRRRPFHGAGCGGLGGGRRAPTRACSRACCRPTGKRPDARPEARLGEREA